MNQPDSDVTSVGSGVGQSAGYRGPPQLFIAVAHAVDEALTDLDVVARKPVQGEAMHKVIAYRALVAIDLWMRREHNTTLFDPFHTDRSAPPGP